MTGPLDNFEIPESPFSLEKFAWDIIWKVLEKYNGNKSKSAQFLGLERHQLYYRYKKIVNKFDNQKNKI